jgi:hypothetical protein
MEAAGGFEPPNRGFADRSLNHLGMPPLITKRPIAVSSVKAKPLFSLLCRFKPLGEEKDGAGDGGRTRDFNLGKVALYH